MLQTIYTRNVNYLASDIHNVVNSVSTIHATFLDVVETVKFISELWDENLESINNLCQGYTSQVINLIESLIVYLTVGNSVKLLSDEVLEGIYSDKVTLSANTTQYFVISFVDSFVSDEVDNTTTTITTTTTNNDSTLEDLKVQAKQLKIKSWASYRNVDKLQAAIDKELSEMRGRFEALL